MTQPDSGPTPSAGTGEGAAEAASVARDHDQLPALDGLRALAVGGVVLTHAAYWTGHYIRGAGESALAHLDVGVALFFTLSGFLLSREWMLAEIHGRRPPRTVAYLWRRALRILPMYWITVVLALLLLPGNDHVSSWVWVRHIFLIEVYQPGWLTDGLTHAWSLCTEVSFYLVLPLIARCVIQLSRQPRFGIAGAAVTTAAVLVAVNIGWVLWYHYVLSPDTSAGFWLPTSLSWFAAGIAMAGIYCELQASTATRWAWAVQVGNSPGVCWVAAACFYGLAITPITGPYVFGVGSGPQAVTKNLLYLGVAVSLTWPAVFGTAAATQVVFASRPARYLGNISYSVYLLHLMLLEGALHLIGYREFTGSTATLFAVTLVFTLPASALAYHFIELPAMRLRRWVRTTPPSVTAAV